MMTIGTMESGAWIDPSWPGSNGPVRDRWADPATDETRV